MPLTRKAAEFNQQQRAQRTEKKVHVAHFIAELFSGKVSQLYICNYMCYIYMSNFPGGSELKNLPVMYEMQVQSLGQEDPLEKEMATHSSILA